MTSYFIRKLSENTRTQQDFWQENNRELKTVVGNENVRGIKMRYWSDFEVKQYSKAISFWWRCLIVKVRVVLRRTVVICGEWCFDSLSASCELLLVECWKSGLCWLNGKLSFDFIGSKTQLMQLRGIKGCEIWHLNFYGLSYFIFRHSSTLHNSIVTLINTS